MEHSVTNGMVEKLIPHLECWNRTMPLIYLHVISDLLIAFSYFAIPTALIMILFKKKEIKFKLLFILFAMFIIACGSTHVMAIITVWKPWFWAEGWVKLCCAIISLITTIVIYPLLPAIIGLKSNIEYKEIIENLETEMRHKDNIIDKLTKIDISLVERLELKQQQRKEQ